MTLQPNRRQVVPTPVRHWRSMHISAPVYIIFALVVFIGTIQVSQYLGFWSTSGKMTPEGLPMTISGADPAELKGWMGIEDVLEAYDLSQDELYARYNIPADLPTSAALKDIEAVAPDFSMDELRIWLTERQAQP